MSLMILDGKLLFTILGRGKRDERVEGGGRGVLIREE
jgi:hypothetical protein